MNELAQKSSESARDWLARLATVEVEKLSLAERRARAGYLADARRLLEQERQKGRWGGRRT